MLSFVWWDQLWSGPRSNPIKQGPLYLIVNYHLFLNSFERNFISTWTILVNNLRNGKPTFDCFEKPWIIQKLRIINGNPKNTNLVSNDPCHSFATSFGCETLPGLASLPFRNEAQSGKHKYRNLYSVFLIWKFVRTKP